MSTIWQAKNDSRENLNEDIKKLLDSASVTDWLGPRDAPILLKPNLVVSRPASGGATTHPEIAAGIIEYLKDMAYSNIAIAEGSWVGDSTTRAYRNCGYNSLSKKYNLNLIDLQKDDAVSIKLHGDEYRICKTIAELEENQGSLINLPVLKGHGQTHLTCALKNLKGCIPDTEKRRYHSLGVHLPVALLNTAITPAFTFVDGLNGDPGWEEGGSPEKRDILLLGRDSVSIDTHACRLLNIKPENVSYIAMAEEFGVGSSDTGGDNVIYLDNASPSSTTANDTAVKEWINNIVDQRSACSACFGNLSAALRELRREGWDIDKKSILIGQDFRSSTVAEGEIGIGICTCGNSIENGGKGSKQRSLKGCPPSKTAIKKFLSLL